MLEQLVLCGNCGRAAHAAGSSNVVCRKRVDRLVSVPKAAIVLFFNSQSLIGYCRGNVAILQGISAILFAFATLYLVVPCVSKSYIPYEFLKTKGSLNCSSKCSSSPSMPNASELSQKDLCFRLITVRLARSGTVWNSGEF